MRPFGARGSAGEARRLCGSAAGQNPLSLFPWKKRKRFLMVSREKGLAAAFRASPRTLAAPVTGVLARLSSGALPPVLSLDRNDSPGPARMLCPPLFAAAPWQFERAWRWVPPGCSALLFSLPHPGSLRGPGAHISGLPQPPNCVSKTEAGGIRERPQLPKPPCVVEWSKPSNQHPNNPRKRREKAFQTEFEMPPPAAEKASRFRGSGAIGGPEGAGNRNAATVCKGATERYEGCPLPRGVPNIAQFAPTTDGGFEAAGLPRHPVPTGKGSEPAGRTPAPPHPGNNKHLAEPRAPLKGRYYGR